MIKLLKSGSWALEGVHIVEMVEGVKQSFGPAEDFKLVEAGWAEWVKADHKVEVSSEAEVDTTAEPQAEEPARKPKAK